MKNIALLYIILINATIAWCQNPPQQTSGIVLAEPYATPSVKNFSKVIGWPEDKTPIAPNGDVFVAAAEEQNKTGGHEKTNCIFRFSNITKDGIPQTKSVYLKGLNQPFGMLIIGYKFFVANTDAVLEYPYNPGDSSIKADGKKIISLPSNGGHWTRNIISNAEGNKLYVAVGSSTNVAENGIDKEKNRACILEVNIDGSGEKIYASGLRNPVGMAWYPHSQTLWTAVNERDELGDELVPDYLTSVKPGGFYGWPYSYFGQHLDPRLKDNQRPGLVKKAIVPDVSLDSHTASLGLVFYDSKQFPEKYFDGAFIGQHGSWNRSKFTGYKVVFVPFKNGVAIGKPENFLTGFIANESKNEVYGRPVGVAVLNDGSLLIADDAGNTIWRVTAQ